MVTRPKCPRCGNSNEGDWLYKCKNQSDHTDKKPIVVFCTDCAGGGGGIFGGLACPVCGENTKMIGKIRSE